VSSRNAKTSTSIYTAILQLFLIPATLIDCTPIFFSKVGDRDPDQSLKEQDCSLAPILDVSICSMKGP